MTFERPDIAIGVVDVGSPKGGKLAWAVLSAPCLVVKPGFELQSCALGGSRQASLRVSDRPSKVILRRHSSSLGIS